MWWPFRRKTVHVTFVDESSGKTFVVPDMPPDQLPETFEGRETTMHVGDVNYSVVGADPPTRAEFTRTGKLALRVLPVTMMNPADVLFSLATIGDELPATTGPAADEALALHEDDWRQMEFVAAGLSEAVEREFAAIRAVYESRGDAPGFKTLHVRKEVPRPLGEGIPAAGLAAWLGAEAESEVAIRFGNVRARVAGGFAFRLRTGGWAYGVRECDRVVVLGLAEVDDGAAEALAGVLGDGYLLVGWLRAGVIEGDGGRRRPAP